MRFLLISLLTLLHYTLFAQRDCNLSISGHVLDEHNEEALAFAEVYIPLAHTGAVVDSSGYYHIDGLCPGVYEIVVSHIGCLPVHRKISLTRNVQGFDFYPEHHTTALEEVQLLNTPQQKPERSNQNLQTLPPSKLRLLQTGQNVVKPIVQGFNGNRVTVVKQGIAIQDQQWGSDHGLSLMLYPDDRLEDNTQELSNFSTLQFAPNNPFEKKGILFGSGFSNGRGASLGALSNMPLSQKIAVGVRAQARKNGDLQTPAYGLTNTAGQEANAQLDLAVKVKEWLFSGSTTYNVQDFGILRASHTGNADDFARALAAPQPAYQRPFSYALDYPRQFAQHVAVAAKAEKNYTKQQEDFTTLSRTIGFSYTYQHNIRQEYDIRRSGNNNTPALDLQLQTHTARLHWQSELSASRKVLVEVQQEAGINTNIPGTGYAPVLSNYNQYNSSVKSSYQQKIKQHGLLRFDIRLQHATTRAQYFEGAELRQPTFAFPTAAASLLYRSAKPGSKGNVLQWQSKLEVVQRAPAPNELLVRGVHHGTASIEEGNTQLNTETKAGMEQQVSYQTGGSVELQANVYGYYIHQYIYQIPEPNLRQTIRGAFPVFAYRQSDALFTGLEAQLKHTITKGVLYTGALNFIYAQDLLRQSPLPLIPPFAWNNALRFTRSVSPRWQEAFISVEHQYTGRQFRYNPQLDLAAPPADYSLFNLAMGISHVKKHTYVFSLRIENLGNHAYRNYLDRFRYFANAPGRNLIVECLINF
jgi:iron complex outermembrane receptor protein